MEYKILLNVDFGNLETLLNNYILEGYKIIGITETKILLGRNIQIK